MKNRDGGDAFAPVAAGSGGALSVSKASFQAKRGSFFLQGSVHGFSLDGAAALALTIGNQVQSVPVGQFRSHGVKTKFRAHKGTHGLAALVIDRRKSTFTALGEGIAVPNISNPARVALTAGGFDGCTLIKLRAKTRSSGALASFSFNGADAQFGCIIPDEPVADPPAFLIAEPTAVAVRATVVPDPDLDPSSVKLWRVDEALNPIDSALGALIDSGDVSSDGNRTYTTTHTFTEASPTRIRLQVSANVTRGGSSQTVWSPSFALDAEPPITPEQFQAAVDTHNAAYQVFASLAAKFGYSLKAATRAARAIRHLPGVRDASVDDNGDISIAYESGIKGVLELHPHPELYGTPVTAAASPTSSEFTRVARIRPADTGRTATLCNNKVLVWNSVVEDSRVSQANDHIQNIVRLFQQSTNPKFDVTYVGGPDATAASVDTFGDYGTLLIHAHESIYHPLDYPVFLTSDRLDPGALSPEQKARFDVEGFALVIRKVPSEIQLRVGVTWRKIARVKFQKNAIVAFLACSSAIAGETRQSNAFLTNGAGAYFGWSDVTNLNVGALVLENLFKGLVMDHKNTTDAYNAIPDKSAPAVKDLHFNTAHAELKLRPEGGTPVAYQLNP